MNPTTQILAISDGVQTALIVGFFTVFVGPVVAWVLNRSTKREEWARQDKVADAVQEASDRQERQAQELKTAQANQSKKLLESNQENAEATGHRFDDLDHKQDLTHDLVNSDKTAALERELASTKRELVSIKENVQLRKLLGDEPFQNTLDEIAGTEARIVELELEIKTRNENQSQIDAKEVVEAAGVIASVKQEGE